MLQQGIGQCQYQGVGALDEGGTLGWRLLKVDAHGAAEAFGGQALFQSLGQFTQWGLEVVFVGLQARTQLGHGAVHKALHIFCVAQGSGGLAPFGQHVIRF